MAVVQTHQAVACFHRLAAVGERCHLLAAVVLHLRNQEAAAERHRHHPRAAEAAEEAAEEAVGVVAEEEPARG